MLRYALLLSSGIFPAVRLATPTTPAPLLRPDAIGTLAVTPEWRRLGISDQNDEVTGSYSSYPKAQTDESLRGLAPTASSVQLLASQPLSPSQGVDHVDCEMDFRPLVVALLPPNSSFWFFNPSLAQSPRSAALLAGTVRVTVIPNDGFGCLGATQKASAQSSISEQMRTLQCRQASSSNDIGMDLVIEFEVANTSPCEPHNASLAGHGEDPRVLRSPNGALVTSSQFWPRYSWNMQRDTNASSRTVTAPVWYKGQRLARWKGVPDEAPVVLQIYEGPHSSVGNALDDPLLTEGRKRSAMKQAGAAKLQEWSDDYRTAYTFRRAMTNCDTYRAANFTCRTEVTHDAMDPEVLCSSASNPLIPPSSVGAAAEAQLLGRGSALLKEAVKSAWPVVQDKNWSPIYLGTKMRNFIFVQQFDPFITCESSADPSEELACSACHHISTSSSQAAVSKLKSRAEAASLAAAAEAGLPTPTSVETTIHLNGAPVLRIPELDDTLVGIVHGITMLRWVSDTGNTTGILKDYRHFFFAVSDKPPFAVTEISTELPLQRAYSAAPWFGPCDLAKRIREDTAWPGAVHVADRNYWNAPACSNVSFVSSMEYADAHRSELLIGYGDGDSSARVLRIPTAQVMRLFKGDLAIRTRNAARIGSVDDPPTTATSTKQHTFLMVAASSNIILVLLIGGVLRLLPQKSGIAAATPTKARRLDHLSGVRVLASFWIVADHLTRWFYQTFCGAEDPDYSLFSVKLASQGFSAVSVFVVMSGFLTHWTSAGKDITSSWRVLLRHYFLRMDRVLLGTFTAMIATGAIDVAFYGENGSVYRLGTWNLLCLFPFLAGWSEGGWQCPCAASWVRCRPTRMHTCTRT